MSINQLMIYLRILCNLILIFTVFEPSKINYARVLMINNHYEYPVLCQNQILFL